MFILITIFIPLSFLLFSPATFCFSVTSHLSSSQFISSRFISNISMNVAYTVVRTVRTVRAVRTVRVTALSRLSVHDSYTGYCPLH